MARMIPMTTRDAQRDGERVARAERLDGRSRPSGMRFRRTSRTGSARRNPRTRAHRDREDDPEQALAQLAEMVDEGHDRGVVGRRRLAARRARGRRGRGGRQRRP